MPLSINCRPRPHWLDWNRGNRQDRTSLSSRTSASTDVGPTTCISQREPTRCRWETGCPWTSSSTLQRRSIGSTSTTSPTWFVCHLEFRGQRWQKSNYKYHTGAEQGEDHWGQANGRERSGDQQCGLDSDDWDDAVLPFCGLLQNPLAAAGGGRVRLHLGGCCRHLSWSGERHFILKW